MAELTAELQDLISELTRYPRDVLEPDADLEEDLGIDSVKLAEIAVAIGSRFGPFGAVKPATQATTGLDIYCFTNPAK